MAAKDNAVFMISNGTSAAGLRSANDYFSGGVATISPTSGLPWITSPMALDARVQPGYAGAPAIELNGSGAGDGVDGLRLDGGASTAGGFVINRFTGNGVQCSSAGGNSVVGNYIGTNAAGTTASANGGNGVLIANNGSNTIGDTVTERPGASTRRDSLRISSDAAEPGASPPASGESPRPGPSDPGVLPHPRPESRARWAALRAPGGDPGPVGWAAPSLTKGVVVARALHDPSASPRARGSGCGRREGGAVRR